MTRGVIAVVLLCLCVVSAATTNTTKANAADPLTVVAFFDAFDRADGPLGPNWLSLEHFGPLVIQLSQVCATGTPQGSVATQQFQQNSVVTVSYEWNAQTSDGLGAYVWVTAGLTGSDFSLMAGCGGGGREICQPIIAMEGRNKTNTPLTLYPGINYRMEVTVSTVDSDAYVRLRMFDTNGTAMTDMMFPLNGDEAKRLSPFRVGPLLTPRSSATCATNFLIDIQRPFTTLFLDSFNRPDGPPGPNYVLGPIASTPVISRGQLCNPTGQGQSMVFWNQALPSGAPGSSTYRVSYTFTASDIQSLESYGLAVYNLTLIPGPAFTELWLAGCDGGGGTCTPTVRTMPGDRSAVGIPPRLDINTKYQFVATISSSYASFRVLSADGYRVMSLVASVLSPRAVALDHLGVLVGRSPTGQSCIGDFALRVAS